MIDKKRLSKSLIIIGLIVIIIFAVIQIRRTLARYETTATTEREVDVAFWIVDNDFKTDTILIDEIYPRDSDYEYTFAVSNFNATKSAETDLSYEIVITASTNLPVSYEITKNGVTCTKIEELYEDASGTCYREIKLETATNNLIMPESADVTDNFVIKVNFPKEYHVNQEYADLIEYIKLDLTATQIIEE